MMFYKALPYILILSGCLGLYWFVDGLQSDNQQLAKDKATLEQTTKTQAEQLTVAQASALEQLETVKKLSADFERDQKIARDLAVSAARDNAELQQNLAKLLEDAKNDPKDDCSFKPMPDHVIRLLFNTGATASTNNHNQDGDGEAKATSKPSTAK